MGIVNRFTRWTVSAAFVGLLFFSLMNVVNRFIVFRFNTAWTEELARYFSVYVIFLGAALATRNKAHPYIGIMLSAMRKSSFWSKLTPWVEAGIVILEIIVLIFVLIKGVEIAYLVYGQTAPASQISMTWPYLAIPIGTVMMLFYYKDYFIRGKKQ